MKKQLMAAAAVASISVAGLGAGVANAASSTSSTTSHPMSGLVDALATKFNLNKGEVQKVVDEQRTTMEAQRETEVKTEVVKLVTDGKISQAQADAINAKRAELTAARETNHDSMKDKTDAERKTARDAQKSALETWAKENNISNQYLRYVIGHGGPGRHGDRGGPDQQNDDSSSPTSTNTN